MLDRSELQEQQEEPKTNSPSFVSYGELARKAVERARAELDRVKTLVENGALPRAKIAEAEEQLADTEDQLTIAETLYSSQPASHMTMPQATAMEEATQRRVIRAERRQEERRKFLEMGIIAATDLEADGMEVENRKSVLRLAQARVELLREIQRMAQTEQQSQAGLLPYASMQQAVAGGAVIAFAGSGHFTLDNLSAISAAFARRWKRNLPVSAAGQTAVHAALGLDHRNRADIALNPDEPEGVWLRHYLEQGRIPYFAFRAAVTGAATAPHIHVGPGSPRLQR